MQNTGILVVGAGIAGLSFAIDAALRCPDKTITVLAKGGPDESSSWNAQGGGLAVVTGPKDLPAYHIEDTLKAGDGLCDRQVVESVVREAPVYLNKLLQMGVCFDRDRDGNLSLGREGGHSKHRIVHCKDATGKALIQTLLAKAMALPNIKVLPHHFAIDLIIGSNHLGNKICYGAAVISPNQPKASLFSAAATVLATGGLGQAYQSTTNPMAATGDGIAMAARAGVHISDMEFIQFHPTALYEPNHSPVFLISEAVRGYGAWLINTTGERFMLRYDSRAELASRDIVARAIETEMERTGTSYMHLDCRHLPESGLKTQFPNIYNYCKKVGLDIHKELVPISPAAHYCCGGIVTNEWGQTNLEHLYAIGECACTGLHGANRLASNSLLEAVVYAGRSHKHATNWDRPMPLDQKVIPEKAYSFNTKAGEYDGNLALLRATVQGIMTKYAGLKRTNSGLAYALGEVSLYAQQLEELLAERPMSVQLGELRNIIEVSKLVIAQSIKRKENRGVYWNQSLM